jgi:ribosomal protein S12 methylthiotransferase
MMIRVNFVSLGCAKNLVDSERLLALLGEAGMVLVGPEDEAEVTIINTCSFIAEAREEAFEVIEGALKQKAAGQTRHVVVAGCLAQHWGEKVQRRNPQIDAVVGLAGREQIAEIVQRIADDSNPQPSVYVEPFGNQVSDDRGRLRLTEPGWAYLRISEGCDRGCSFCTIPRIRGPFRSKGPEAILAEAEELVNDGALELNLIGQETTSYGSDLGYAGGLATLLRELNRIDGLRWLRILYAHPATMNEELIMTMAECEKAVAYVDMPLQHINNRILELMHRRITREETESLLQKLRARIPEVAIRTTMLVGFPSETQEEFTELLDFVQEQRFEALGGFRYSAEPGTRAAHLKKTIPERIQRERYDQLMLTQQEIAFTLADQKAGNIVDCLVSQELSSEEILELGLDASCRWYSGRSAQQAPEMDSECLIAADTEVAFDTIVPVKIEGRHEYDLLGTVIEKEILSTKS